LQLIGSVKNKHVLELGCGGAQCSIAFAKKGAIVTAVDVSSVEIEFAKKLADENNGTDLGNIKPISWGKYLPL